MKKLIASLAGLGASLFFMPLVLAAPGDGLAGTKHDFSGIGNPQTGACTFCHTPHKAQSQALLWNHALTTNTFSWTDTVTTAGTAFPTFVGDSYKGPTVKCLSCHDGSVAIGDIGWWNGGDPGTLLNVTIPNGENAFSIGFGGDMTGNHPVAMPFPYQNAPSTYNGSTTGSGITLVDWKADPRDFNIVLYNDDGAGNISRGAVPGQTGIECGSCHDPHNGPKVTGPWFLYVNLGGATGADGYICEKCHNKSGS